MTNWLICGTRKKKKDYKSIVFEKLSFLADLYHDYPEGIVEGCCIGSADEWTEEWAKTNIITLHHFLSRNPHG